MYRVKIFKEPNIENLERVINKFLEDNEDKIEVVKEVSIQNAFVRNNTWNIGVLVYAIKI